LHTFHEDVLDAGLDIDCPRCRELIEHPTMLDEPNITRLATGHLYSPGDEIAATNLRQQALAR
jgi:hypothetical protein